MSFVATRKKLLGVAAILLGSIALLVTDFAGAAEAPVDLGLAEPFAVLGGAGVTNTGPSLISGDLGTSPTAAVTGFPPGLVVNGTVHGADAAAAAAQAALTTAYNDAAGRTPTTTYLVPTDLGGMTLTPGVYKSPSSFGLTGTLTLDSQGDPNAVFIFQAGSTLINATNSHVALIGTNVCNVFWQVGSSATISVGSTFAGTILAMAAITANTNAVIQGRLLARTASVTLDTNTITAPVCAPATTTTTATTSTTTIPVTTTSAPATTTTTTIPVTTTSSAPSTTTTTVAVTTTTSAPVVTTTTGVPATSTTTSPAPTTTSALVVTTTAVPVVTTLPLATTTSRPAASTTVTSSTPRFAVAAATTTTSVVTTTTSAQATGLVSTTSPNRETSRSLTRTGASTSSQVAAALLALALGSLLIVLSRRRLATSAP